MRDNPKTINRSGVYILSIWEDLCVCVSNGRPNGLHDLEKNFGIDSHLPYG